jgi:large repetitive protein
MALFQYNLSVSGDCHSTSSGAFNIAFYGGVAPYTVVFNSLPYPSVTLNEYESTTVTNLFSQVVLMTVNDSTLPTNQSVNLNVPISSGVCCSVLSVQNTTCAQNNGLVTGTTNSVYSSNNFYLYSGDGSFIISAVSNTSTVVFSNLTAGTYFLGVEDLGGCSAYSQNFIVEQSKVTNYGLYSVPNSSCGGAPIGKIMVTGLTGQGPFTYLWSNGQTGSTATGLTEGIYTVEVKDGFGCTTTQSANVVNVEPLGLGLFTATNPTCFSPDGSIELTITGGTAPYYYSASTGNVLVSYSQTYTLSGLSAGDYEFLITDAGFCSVTLGTTLLNPDGISSVNVDVQNSFCSSNNGELVVSVVGGQSPYTYTLVNPDASQTIISGPQQIQKFLNLSAGTYSIFVKDTTGCEYSQEVFILTSNKFTISTTVTGTSCNQNNGSVYISCSTGYNLPLDYSVDGIQNVIDTNLTAVTFNNLSSGNHVVTVTDSTGCQQTQTIFIPKGDSLDFSLYSINCGSGNSGQITAFITSGTPPFEFNWSANVEGNPQQIQVFDLTGGTYSLQIVDDNGCSLSRTTTITCDSNYTSYQCYVMGQEIFNVQSPTKLGLLQMLNEGYYDLTSGNTNCDLISAIFTAKVNVNPAGLSASRTFFTATTLNNPPSDNLWYNTIKSLLLSIPGIQSVTIDQINNQITIATNPANNSLNGQEIVVELAIVYDIMCLT